MAYKITYKASELSGPYQILEEYFGAGNSDIVIACEGGVDVTYHLIEIVSADEIIELLRKHNFEYDSSKNEDRALLWGLYMNANIHYGDIEKRRSIDILIEMSQHTDWESIQEDLIPLYALLNETEGKPVKVRIGKKTVKLNNTNNWFHSYLLKGMKIAASEEELSKEIVKERKKPGPKKNVAYASTCVGVAKLFRDCGRIEGYTTNDMCRFIREYLVLMKVIEVTSRKSIDNIKTTIGRHLRLDIKSQWYTPHLIPGRLEDLKDDKEWVYERTFLGI